VDQVPMKADQRYRIRGFVFAIMAISISVIGIHPW
jgi:hypothetical protein